MVTLSHAIVQESRFAGTGGLIMKELAKHLLGLTLVAGCGSYFLGRVIGVQSPEGTLLLTRFFVEIFFSGAALLGGGGILASASTLARRLRRGDDFTVAGARNEVLALVIASSELLVAVLVLVLGGFVKSGLIAAVHSA
jgi:hypothetical protein